MGILFRTLDLTSIEEGVIAHGVNCQSAMGSGVAKDLYTKWPQVRTAYKSMPQSTMKLGLVQPVRINDKLVIMNCFTQEYYGREPNRKYATPSAIGECINKVCRWMLERHIYILYIPFIGCNLGGLNWEKEVLPVVKAVALLYPRVNIVVCSKPQN